MFVPISVLFLTRSVGLPLVQVGLGLTIAGAVAVVATPLSGHLGDRYDARILAAIGYATCAAGFAAYTQVRSFAVFVVLAVVIGAFAQLASSARKLIAVGLTEGGERLALLAYERSTRNAGYGLGGLLASLALVSGAREGYVAILLANAASYAAGAVLLLRMPAPTRPPQMTDGGGGYRAVLRDRPYVTLAALSGLLGANDSLLKIALPLWIVRRTTVSPALVGIYFALNTALVVGLQVRTSRAAAGVRGAARAYLRGAVALAVCCGLFAATVGIASVFAALVLGLAIVALTAGEMLVSAAQWGVSIELLRESLRGRYLGVFATATSIQSAAGPVAVTVALVDGGEWGWLGLALFFVMVGVAARRVALLAAGRQRPG